MATYNATSSYNRTYEKKVIEESPRVRITTQTHTPLLVHGLPDMKMMPGMMTPLLNSLHSTVSGTGAAQVTSLRSTDDSFFATLDVGIFDPEQLQVTVSGNNIVVEGRHNEKPDEFGTIERSFIRKFPLPRSVQPEAVTSQLTSDGLLTIEALPPKPKKESSPARQIPIKIVNPSSPNPPAEAKTTAENN